MYERKLDDYAVKESETKIYESQSRHTLYLKKNFVEDSAFPFKPKEDLVAKIVGDKLIIEKSREEVGLEYWMALNDFEIDNTAFNFRSYLSREDYGNIFRGNYDEIEDVTSGMPSKVRKNLENLRNWASSVSMEGYREAKRNLRDRDIRIISEFDDEYPQFLKEREPKYPRILYYKGGLIDFKGCVAVVGTRNPSENQASKARELGRFLAKKDFTVVSGLALGVDTNAHKGALDVGGETIAVLPNIRKITPESNQELAQEIVEKNGALLAIQFDPSKLSKHKWVKRNRVTSGISRAVCAFASPGSKGTYHQIRFAREQGIKVLALRTDDKESIFSKMEEKGVNIVSSKENLLNYLEKEG